MTVHGPPAVEQPTGQTPMRSMVITMFSLVVHSLLKVGNNCAEYRKQKARSKQREPRLIATREHPDRILITFSCSTSSTASSTLQPIGRIQCLSRSVPRMSRVYRSTRKPPCCTSHCPDLCAGQSLQHPSVPSGFQADVLGQGNNQG